MAKELKTKSNDDAEKRKKDVIQNLVGLITISNLRNS